MDRIDRILKQWNSEKPELDVSAMGLIGRLGNVAFRVSHEMEKTFQLHGLNRATFDLLATLRRSGPPYTLSPGELMESTMVTSGTVTNRIDQLEKDGLVKRGSNPRDKRGIIVSLTDKGFQLMDRAVIDHVETQSKLVSLLTARDRKELNRLLSQYLLLLEKEFV